MAGEDERLGLLVCTLLSEIPFWGRSTVTSTVIFRLLSNPESAKRTTQRMRDLTLSAVLLWVSAAEPHP